MEKIAIIMGKMHSGGKKNLVMEYYRNIDKNEIQFDFLCDTDSNAIPKEEIEKLGGTVYEITPYQNIFKNIKDIKRICKKNQYKIVHGYNGTMNLFAMFAGWNVGVPFRINESISMSHSADRKTILKKILKPFSRCFSTHYMANGESCGRWQFGDTLYAQGKIAIFKTVIDTQKNRYDEYVRKQCRKQLKLERNLVIGHIGRLTEQKNTLFIIDIFAEIYRRNQNARLLLIGDGNLREAMLSKIKSLNIENAVLYLGRREDIQQFYNAMDCFLLPSLYEGLPVVGVEAETCGLPVFFSTEVPKESGVCEELSHFLDLKKPVEEWAEEILMKTQANLSQRRSYENEVKAAGFDSKTEANKLLQYYKDLLRSRKDEKHQLRE
ncbi:MAG: glycosyltransferase family 1 protein [Lachnospiraceae bacterium]|nr:glycosyltransferase family 1 protein [Lachnospiraceae bacterium]